MTWQEEQASRPGQQPEQGLIPKPESLLLAFKLSESFCTVRGKKPHSGKELFLNPVEGYSGMCIL